MLTWAEKLTLLTQKGMTWAEIKEMDKGLEEENNNPPEENNNPPEENNNPPEEKPEEKPGEKPEPTENEKKLLEKIEELEGKLKDAQDDNVHGNNGGSTPEPTFDEQLNEMFKDYRI